MMKSGRERLIGLCGSAHVLILLANLVVTGAAIGVLWGNLSTKVDNLREAITRERDQQLQWNAGEQRQDDIHRERMNEIQGQIIELLKELKRTQ